MGKHLLDMDFDFDFDLIGICSNYKDYKFVWGINQSLNIQLVRAPKDHVISPNGFRSIHTIYRYYCEHTHISYELLANKGTQEYLVPEKRQIDFFLILYDNIIINLPDVVRKLRTLTFVSTAMEIEVDSLKNKENLITD